MESYKVVSQTSEFLRTIECIGHERIESSTECLLGSSTGSMGRVRKALCGTLINRGVFREFRKSLFLVWLLQDKCVCVTEGTEPLGDFQMAIFHRPEQEATTGQRRQWKFLQPARSTVVPQQDGCVHAHTVVKVELTPLNNCIAYISPWAKSH